MKPIFKVNSYDFSNYRLSVSQPGIRVFAIVVSIFNLLLLIPDMINLSGVTMVAVCLLRLFYTALCVLLYFNVTKFQTFKSLSATVTAAELLAVIVFLVVFWLYRTPDLIIQLLGIMLLILFVFMVPNRFYSALAVSLFAAAGFFAVALGIFGWPDTAQYVASVVYIAAEIVLGSVFAYIFLQYQRREYETKTELQKMYATDPLTQVGNRVRLEKEADKWLNFCRRHNLPLSLVIIDIDNMKHINDKHGHLTGDATICELVQTVCSGLRRHDIFIRWGGDEFVLLLPGTSISAARKLIERLRKEVDGHVFPAESRITCSFGIADLDCGDTLEALLRSADEFLYQAKKQGKNTACDAADQETPRE